MLMDNIEKQKLADVYGEDMAEQMATISMSKPITAAEKEQAAYQRYGMAYEQVKMSAIKEQNRIKNDGIDHVLKDMEAAFDNDPRLIEARREQEAEAEKRAEDERFYRDFCAEQKQKAKFSHEVDERHGTGTYARLYGE
jgi:hypothetical protein